MTEFSTNNDNGFHHNKTHLTSQPLQSSPTHFHQQQSFLTKANLNSPHRHHHHYHRLHHNNQREAQPLKSLNSNANIRNNGNGIALATTPTSSPVSHSPRQYYKNPLNSPSNSPLFTTANTTIGIKRYQQQLNDRLLQQQHLQLCQQQQLQQRDAGADDDDGPGEDLSEESLKQNVAIVLNNLDRYNNTLRSLILNEQVNSSSSLFLVDDNLELEDQLLGIANNNGKNRYGNVPGMAATPESDYNSNATTPGARSNCELLQQATQQQQQQQQQGVGGKHCGGGVGVFISGGNIGGNNVNCSLASSHDFTHDNSDYQWFLDYGYRDGGSGMQRSVLSSLSASYNAMGDLIYYEDLAKNIDANLAEVDMESFRAEDIHSLLSHLPAYCKSLGGANSRLEQSLLLQQQQQIQQQQMQLSNMLPHMSQTSTTSTNELIDNSICKSELLFSPVKESHISLDSLDMDAYPDEGDIILTCKANKDNYTIAFEGSVLYSDDSFYAEPNEMMLKNKQNYINLHSNLDDIVKRNKALEVSMSRSAQTFQPQCPKSPKAQMAAQLQRRSLFFISPTHRYPSGNNNNSSGTDTITITRHLPQCSVRRSSSMPNLQEQDDNAIGCSGVEQQAANENQQQQLNVSQAISTSTMESCKSRNLLPMCQMPISISLSVSERLQQQTQAEQQQQQITTTLPTGQHRHKHRCSCALTSTQGSQALCSGHSHQKTSNISPSSSSSNSNPLAFNLVKLFIKQKSTNSAGDEAQTTHTCMDVSSGCWPSSDAAGSSSSSSLEERKERKKSMNDSGKGSAVSRQTEEEDDPCERSSKVGSTPKRQLRTRCDAVFDDDNASSSSTGSLGANNSPAHRRRSMPLRNPQLYQLAANTADSHTSQVSSDASNSEQLTQISAEAKSRRRNEPLFHASNSEMITRSMQTSCGSLSTTRSSLSERYRCVPPSFLAKLNNLGEERQAPIYVIYPNYALPDLGFVKTSATADVIFSPFNYKMTMESAANASASLKRRSTLSANEDELLRTLDYKHISDWQSLATLLPLEYRRRLQHIPEVRQIVHQLESELSQRPLFCMSPPIRRNQPHICDCAQYFQQQQQQEEASSSGSSQPPSSGYRGSSTLLTDSEMDGGFDPLKQMYVYQYEQQRMDSGVETSPATRQPMPRSILRKANSTQSRSKRNSMIEAQQSQKLSKLEKRRSLQEPPFNYALGSADELAEVFEEEELKATPQPSKPRLSRKDLDARARAESFLASLPRSELKYYAEIAAILESSGDNIRYDAAALKKEVSRALTQQKKVSFNDAAAAADAATAMQAQAKRFSTPPNSPNISAPSLQRRETLDVLERRKIESNRFKRLQIQWELMSKDSSMLKELACEQATKSGGSTPTSATANNSAQKSRIPRPVSYPAGRSKTPQKTCSTPDKPKSVTKTDNKNAFVSSPRLHRVSAQDPGSGLKSNTRSPSRIVPPKRYSLATTPTSTATTPPTPGSGRARTPTSRTAVTAPNTPKRQGVSQPSRPIPRVR